MSHDFDFGAPVVAHDHRAAQRDLRRRIAANDRIVHVEEEETERWFDLSMQLDAAFRVFGLQPLRVEHVVGKRARQLHVVELPAVERQHPRLSLLDDADLDAADDRQLSCRHCAVAIAASPGSLPSPGDGIGLVAKVRIRFEHDLLSAHPLLQPVRPGADRVLHHAIRRSAWASTTSRATADSRCVGEPVLERVVGVLEADAQRVAVDRLQALDLRVVVERDRSCARVAGARRARARR